MAGATSTLVPNACSGITGSVVLNAPSGLAINGMGDLFIADHWQQLRPADSESRNLQDAVGQCSNDSSGNPATALNKPYGLSFSPTQSLLITETTPDNVVSYVLGSSSLTVAAGLPNGASGPYSPTQDGNSALSAPLNAPRGIAVDSFGNFSLADSATASRANSAAISSFLDSRRQRQRHDATHLCRQPERQSLCRLGPRFQHDKQHCSGALSPATPGAIPNTCQVFVRFTPTRPGLRRAPISLTDSNSGKTIFQGLQAVATGSLSVFTPGTVNTIASSLAAPTAVTVDSTGNAYVLEAGNTPAPPIFCFFLPVAAHPRS